MEVEKLEEKEDVPFLEELIGTRAKFRTFDFLLSHPIYDYTVQDICEYTEMPETSVANALNIFTKYGIVRVTRKVGEKVFYQINMENPIVEAFLELDLKLAKILLDMEK